MEGQRSKSIQFDLLVYRHENWVWRQRNDLSRVTQLVARIDATIVLCKDVQILKHFTYLIFIVSQQSPDVPVKCHVSEQFPFDCTIIEVTCRLCKKAKWFLKLTWILKLVFQMRKLLQKEKMTGPKKHCSTNDLLLEFRKIPIPFKKLLFIIIHTYRVV